MGSDPMVKKSLNVLSSNMPTFVSVCIAKKGTGNRERGVSKNRHFLQVIGCVREY